MRRSAGLISISMRVVHFGIDEHAGEGRVAARIGIEWRLAYQAMHAGLGAQRAVRIVAAHLERRAGDAGDFAERFFQHLHVEAAPLAETQIHALEQGSPVLRLGAAGAGLDVDEAVPGIQRVGEHAAELEIRHRRLDLAHVLRDGFERGQIVLRARHRDQLAVVLQFLRDAIQRADYRFEGLALLADVLGALGVRPQGRIFGQPDYFVEAAALGGVVKDTSAVRRSR